jgi:hypothetical protein
VPRDGSFADGSGGSQGQTGPRSETLTNDKVNPDTERGPEEVAVEQNQAQGEKAKGSTEVGANSQQPPNWTIQFLQVQDRGGAREPSHLGRHQHLIGVL